MVQVYGLVEFTNQSDAYQYIKERVPQEVDFLLAAFHKNGRHVIVAFDDDYLQDHFIDEVENRCESPETVLGNYIFYEFMEVEEGEPRNKQKYLTKNIKVRKLEACPDYELTIDFN